MAEVGVKTVAERTITAVVTRADGTVENLGVVSYHSQNMFKRWVYKLGQLLGIWRR